MSNLEKFKKKEFKAGANPVDFYNENFNPDDFLRASKAIKVAKDSKDIITTSVNPETCLKWYEDEKYYLFTMTNVDPFGLVHGDTYTPFQVLSHCIYKGDYRKAMQYVEFKYMNDEVPYIRIGTNYFKRIHKKNRYGVTLEEIKPWKKEEIKEDHGGNVLKRIHKFDDFTISPDNKEYSPIVNGCWNLYEPFPHKLHNKPVTIDEIPVTANFMAHVFGEQIELGYIYMKVLYEHPRQILPVLSLVSKDRGTGKTTFLNWLDMIFGNNYTMITPDDLTNSFNSAYAYKNIIGIDEAVVDKMSAVEKIKSIATAKTITVNMKMVAQYRIPFFGKIVITTNKEKDFMRIDTEEVRFWVRKLQPIDEIITSIEDKLLAEVPKFLRYLADMPAVDFSQSRMVFTADQLNNIEIELVKQESWSGLRKDITYYLTEYFQENDQQKLELTPTDIKTRWFDKDGRISVSYITKVLKDEMGYEPEDFKRYLPWNDNSRRTKPGKPYLFKRNDFCKESINNDIEDYYPF